MSELDDLLEACRAAPLAQGVVRSMIRTASSSIDCTAALDWLESLDPNAYASETRELAAGLLLANDRPQAAAAWSETAEEPDLAAEEAPHAAVVVDLKGRPLPIAPAQPISVARAVTFAEVGGLEALKAEIRRKIILPFTQQGLFEKFKKRSGGGILLYGPPGCGKTLLARATAGEVKGHFVSVSVPEILSKWLGESEQRLAAVFDTARAHRPSVLFFDEIEALAGRRDHAGSSALSTVISTLLTLMDGAGADNEGVLVLGATNVPWSVDPAFRRQGRFDRVLFVPPPDREARVAILQVMIKDRPGADRLDLNAVAQRTSAFSAADLAQVVDIACDLAIEASLERNAVVDLQDRFLMEAIDQTRPTTLEWLTDARNYAKFANEGGLYDDVVRFLNKGGK